MKISYLGAGCWGYCLANLLASKGYAVTVWTHKAALALELNQSHQHPFLPTHSFQKNLRVTTNLEEALENSDLIIESVTSSGVRSVFEKVKALKTAICPIVITSKGIEQNSGLILPQVVKEVMGEDNEQLIGILSGPGYAEEVIRNLPTSVVAASNCKELTQLICQTFTTSSFRVYPNSDLQGVAFGGALKNIIAIACGIAEGLRLGWSTKAALITRGLHEIRKLAIAKGCRAETLNGLSGMGDLCMTCSCNISRNFRFGELLAQGMATTTAQEKIKTVVEGAYTCLSALQLSKQLAISMPITETVYQIIYEGLKPLDAVLLLMKRPIKEENQ